MPDSILAAYQNYLAVTGTSEHTAKTYLYTIHTYQDYLRAKNINPLDATTSDILAYFSDQCSTLAPSSKNTKLFALKNFYKYLLLTAQIAQDPTALIPSFKTPFREPQKLSDSDLAAVLDALKGTRNQLRDTSIILTAAVCCLRVSEIVGIDLTDITDNTLHIIGKGNKERFVPLSSSVVEAMEKYLSARPSSPSPALYLSSTTKERMTTRSVQHLIESLSQKTGLDFHTHTLRHTGASYIYDATKDIVITQEILGHTNISTTRRYIHTDDSLKKRAINQSALNRIAEN